MERRIDYLKFRTGGKMTVPFETFLIFSTNMKPDQLGDEAFLRRIRYKMLLRSPGEDEFSSIFRQFCESRALPYEGGLIEPSIHNTSHNTGKTMRRPPPPN